MRGKSRQPGIRPFGWVTAREAAEADRFFDDLTGRPRPPYNSKPLESVGDEAFMPESSRQLPAYPASGETVWPRSSSRVWSDKQSSHSSPSPTPSLEQDESAFVRRPDESDESAEPACWLAFAEDQPQQFPSSRLAWTGATDEQIEFMRRVYDAQVRNASRIRSFVGEFPASELEEIARGYKLRRPAGGSCRNLLAAARAELSRQQGNGVEKATRVGGISVVSAYRSASEQFRNWQRAFPTYYAETREHRSTLSGGSHGPAAVEQLATYIGGRLAAPGYSLHNNGLAVDFGTTDSGRELGARTSPASLEAWRRSWLWDWLTANAAGYQFFQNTRIDEPWHWEYRPAAPSSDTIVENTEDLESWNPAYASEMAGPLHGYAPYRDSRSFVDYSPGGGETESVPNLDESFSGQVYKPNWTSFMPFELNGKPHYLSYNVFAGAVSFDRIRPGAQPDPATGYPVDVIHTESWTGGWTTVMPFKLPGDTHTHYLAYKLATGDASIDRIKADGKGDDNVWNDTWTTGWTHFVPLVLSGKPHYLAYKSATGDVSIDRIKADGKGVDSIWGTSVDSSIKWTPGWILFMPFVLGGRPHYLAYKATGEVTIDRIKADGKGVDTLWGTPIDSSIKWTPGWTQFMPFMLDGKPHYLAYKAATGDVSIDRIKADGKGVDTLWGTAITGIKWSPGWTTLMPFTMDGKPWYFCYNMATGWVAVGSIAEELRRTTKIKVEDFFDYVALDFRLEDRSKPVLPLQTAFRDKKTLKDLLGGDITPLLGEPIKEDPKDAKKFLTRIRMQLVFPEQPASPARSVGIEKLPLAVLVHGQHQSYSVGVGGGLNDKQSFRGYRYLQEHLAQMGIASISVDTNMANLTDSLIELRADTVLEAMKLLKSRVMKRGDVLFDRIDFKDRVGLMGHSRGGDAVVKVVKKNSAAAPAERFGIRTVCSLAPTDFSGSLSLASRMIIDSTELGFYSVLYGTLDGDVAGDEGSSAFTGTGFRHYDRARCPKALVFAERCCHNSFNSVWHADGVEGGVLPADTGKLLTDTIHQDLAKEYIGGQFSWRLLGDNAKSGLFNGATPSATGRKTMLLWSFGNPVLIIDDIENPLANLLAGKRKLDPGAEIKDFGSIEIPPGTKINDNVMGQTQVLHAAVSPPAMHVSVETALPVGRGDLSSFTTLALDVGAYFDVKSEATIASGTPPAFRVSLHDKKGSVATVPSSDFKPAMEKPFFHKVRRPRQNPVTGAWGYVEVNVTALSLETVRVPLSQFTAIDLHNVVKIQIETLSTAGHLFFDNIKVAAF